MDPFADWQSTTVASGARIWSKALTGERVRISVYVPVGRGHDPDGLAGLTHLTEHVLLSVLPDVSEEELLREVWSRAGGRNGHTYTDHTRYYVEVPVSEASFAADFLADIVTLPRDFPAERVEEDRLEVIREHDLLPPALPGAGGLSSSPISYWERELGMPKRLRDRESDWQSLHRITPDDVQRWWEQWYGPQNLTFVVVGGGDVGALVRQLAARLDTIPRRGETHGNVVPADPSPELSRRAYPGDATHGRIRLRWRVPHLGPDDVAPFLLAHRLMVRRVLEALHYDDKLAYEVDGNIEVGWGHATLEVSAEVPAHAMDAARRRMLAIYDELRAPSDEWDPARSVRFERERDEELARLLADHDQPGAFYRDSWAFVFLSEAFEGMPSVSEQWTGLSGPQLARWIDDHVQPHGRSEVANLPAPEQMPLLALALGGLPLFAAWLWGGRAGDLTRLRFLQRLRSPLMGVAGALVGLMTGIVLLPLTWTYDGAGPLWSVTLAGCWVVLLCGVWMLPARVLLLEHELRIETLGPGSWSWPLEQVRGARVERLHRLWRSGHPAVPLSPIFGRGVAVELRSGTVLFLHTGADDELVREIQQLQEAGCSSSG